MNIEELYQHCINFTIDDLDKLIDNLRDLRSSKFNTEYVTVRLYPGNRIENKIEEETGFYCYHEPVWNYSMGRGTHVVVIPKEKYSEKLAKELTEKYDNL